MKNYLSLIPISAKVHKRQNRMILLCIIISVFLVTTVFSMADMALRAEKTRLINRHGNWHIQLEDVSEGDAEQISRHSDVAATAWYDVINYGVDEEYYIGNKKAVLYGVDEEYITEITNGLAEGSYPQNNREIMLSSNAKDIFGIHIGDSITANTPSGSIDYIVSGFGEDDDMFKNQTYLIGAYMNREAFREICNMNHIEDSEPIYYIQFKEHINISKAIADIKEQYRWTDKNISENTAVLGVTGFSSNFAMRNLYTTAAVLFVLIMIAGVLMISGSINSNVAQRTKFFGMMRCIGATRQQIICFVRLEALNWCKTAVPAGIGLGIVITWAVCATLRFGIGGEFAEMPLFGLSAMGMISGVLVGIVTVLLAAQSAAKRAAKVSPVAAVSGNMESTRIHHAANTRYAKIETVLGIHHAIAAKKNLILMTGSFALSIILILGFSAGLDFARALLPSLRTWQPDCNIIGYGNACSLERELVDEINDIPGVKRVYGNIYVGNVPALSDKNNIDHVNLVSYDEYMLECAKKDIINGDLLKVYGDSNYVLTVYGKDNPLKVGDKIQINGTEIEVAGALSDGVFVDDMILICSEETLTKLTGQCNYSLINVQFTERATDETVQAISDLAGDANIFSDLRDSNRESNATFWATRLFGYGFLAIIGLITVFYIINSTSMSVSARIRQYGSMRAVGMDGWQLTKMIAVEVFTYALFGCVIGCALGLPLNRFLFEKLVTAYFGEAWSIPIAEILVILLVVFASAAAAVYTPAKRIRNMVVTDTINEL